MSAEQPIKGREREEALAREEFLVDAYFSLEQLWSFSEQIYHLRRAEARRIIEVGVGNGFVSGFLRTMGLEVLTCDINPNLKPDLLVSVTDLHKHVQPGDYDLISCCEVMEHMPFEHFEETMQAFSRLADKLFLTVPVYGWKFGLSVKLSFMSRVRWISRWFAWPAGSYRMIPMHFWEVGSQRETRHRELIAILRRHYRSVESDYLKMNPYHRYYKCAGAKSAE